MMKRLIAGLSVVVLGAAVLMAADNSWRYPVPSLGGLVAGDLIYAQNSSNLGNINAVAAGQVLTSAGTSTKPTWSATLPTGASSPEKTDGSVFLPAINYCTSDQTTFAITRIAANDWSLATTAVGAATINVFCSLDSWLQRTTSSKGIKVTSLDIVYQITATDLDAHTWGKVASVTYASNVANSVGTEIASAPTFVTTATTNPYLHPVTISTQAYFPTAADVGLTVEWSAQTKNTGVYRVYGINVNFNRTDL